MAELWVDKMQNLFSIALFGMIICRHSNGFSEHNQSQIDLCGDSLVLKAYFYMYVAQAGNATFSTIGQANYSRFIPCIAAQIRAYSKHIVVD